MTSFYRHLNLRAKPKHASSFPYRLTILHPALSHAHASKMMHPQAFAVPRKFSHRLLAQCLARMRSSASAAAWPCRGRVGRVCVFCAACTAPQSRFWPEN